jgi:hypothetical protein
MNENSMLELFEIEQNSKDMQIQYINQIEKALFGEFNNGQKDFPKIRLKETTWTPYVCFKAQLSVDK